MNLDDTVASYKDAVWRVIDEGFNQGRYEIADELCADDFVNAIAVYPFPAGPHGLSDHMRASRDLIADFNLRVVDLVGEGDVVCVLWQTVGASGAYFGGAGAEPTSAWLIGFWRFEQGKLRRFDGNWEPVRLFAQAGLLNAPPTTIPHGPGWADIRSVVGLRSSRDNRYASFATAQDATAHRSVEASARREVELMLTGVVSYGLGLGDEGSIDRWIAEDAYLSFADAADGVGPAALEARRRTIGGAFEVVGLQPVRHLIEDGRVAARWRVELRHTGRWLGLEATGRQATVSASAVGRTEGGRLVQWVELIDLLSLLRDLGGLSGPMPGCLPAQ